MKFYQLGKLLWGTGSLEIRFKDKKIRQLCEQHALAQKKLGADCARKLRSRLGDLEAASRVTDLIAGNPHSLKGDRIGQFALDLARGWRLVFAPDHQPCPKRVDGSINWFEVTIVCIEYIGDYHD
ncbi:MAG: killer suppression protein HigA [Methylococcaceae bacterium]|nr:killer suppression protein HigA [Methylococcaceae bacterium]